MWKPATQNEGGCPTCYACHVKRRWMLPSATPATQSGAADQARHQTQPSVINATPAAQNKGGCLQVLRLQRETTVDATKCHACHAKWRSVTGDQRGPSASPDPAKCHKLVSGILTLGTHSEGTLSYNLVSELKEAITKLHRSNLND